MNSRMIENDIYRDNISIMSRNYNIIDNKKFWSVVNEMKWYELSKAYKKQAIELMSNYLMDNFSVDEIAELQRREVEKRMDMEDFIKSYVKENDNETQEYKLDDMETIDLASHIVGMGRTMFLYVKDNPSIIYNLQNDYVACFEDSFDKAIYSINFAE